MDNKNNRKQIKVVVGGGDRVLTIHYKNEGLDSLKNQKNQVADGSGPSNANGPQVNESVLVERNEDEILDTICSSIDLDKLSCPTMSRANRWADTLIITRTARKSPDKAILATYPGSPSGINYVTRSISRSLVYTVEDDVDPKSKTSEIVDVDMGLRGLEAYDLISLSQPASMENKEEDSDDDVSLEDETIKGADDSELEFDDEMNFNVEDEGAGITYDIYYKDDDVCKNRDCNWRIHAAKFPEKVTWQIKSLKGKHKCPRLGFNSMATYSWITRHLYEDYVVNPAISVASMQELLTKRYGLTIPSYTARKAKRLCGEWAEALQEIFLESPRRICAIHYYRNFARYYPGSMQHSLFFAAVYAFNEFVHKKAMKKI
ncbi:hypothetical protein Cgig2_005969 [Carnegiea gigantea]|uniref:Transposase MuDR plant domain-containing protein n=1 Tax=Carnegiea gigantea TaxID=171969 RepID=A0A9Q1QJE7_9CARY|nr:hypothetical protein Cgig2_005969 [Carnegiea gigantea]